MHVCKGGQISEVGAKFPRKFGPGGGGGGGANFRGGQISCDTVSPIMANLCMEEIEELAFCQTDTPPKKWYIIQEEKEICIYRSLTVIWAKELSDILVRLFQLFANRVKNN